MDLTFEEAVARVKSGEKLGSLLMSLGSPSEMSMQRGAALVRSFDRETFNMFSLAGGAVDFDRFVKQRFVEPVPGSDRTYRVRDADRQTLLKGWIGSDEWRGLNASLATFFHERSPAGSVDELHHLIALGSDREADASALFVRLFDAAESKFDLSPCAELLDIVSDQSHQLSDAFHDTIKERRCRLRARHMWSEEFVRTTPYHERTFLADGLERLLTDGPQSLLHVFAGGGMGKTMFVRWAIARYLVPKGIPCARLDFDFEQPSWLSQRPWRLVLKIARQLNEQMTDAPFTELVKEYGDAEAEEDRASRDPAQNLDRARSYDAKYNEEAFNRFMWSLAETRSATPPVIIWDTLERVSLYYPQDLLALVDRFAGVWQQYPRLRMLLAGRYNLGQNENLPGFAERYGSRTLTISVVPFTAQEGHEYLTERRGLPSDARVDAIVDRSDGVPFKLSLFATMVQDDATLDEKAIREMPNVNVEFLIKRVVDQIKEPLAQWVLRHGVVPRQLTRTFLRDVWLPRLQEIQRGASTLDSGLDTLPERLQNPERFKRGLLAEPLDVDDLWRTLNRYAADYSWISQSKDWPDTLVFHADVVDAMRGLLQEHGIFYQLHEDAIRHYEAKAAADEANWSRWTREALYHQFQRGGPGAAAAWKKALEQASARGDAKGRRAVAEEILMSEYVDETGTPRRRGDGAPMVPLELLVLANYQAAHAGIEEARLRRVGPNDQLWLTADRRIREAVRIESTLTAPVVPQSAITMVSAAIELVRSPESALQLLEGMRKDVTPEIAAEFEELYGDALWAQDVSAASQHYRAALDHLPDGAIRSPRAMNVAFKVADAAVRTGDYVRASAVGQRVLTAAEAAGDTATAGRARVCIARALLAAGLIDDAIAVCLDAKDEVSEVDRAKLDATAARARLLAGDPLGAWRDARRRFRRAFDDNVETDPTYKDATGLELKADLHAACFEFEDALAAWRGARHAWDLLRYPDRSLHCVLRSVSVLVRETQEFALAAQMMSEAERTAASLGANAELVFRTLEVERLAPTEPASAVALLDSILSTPNLATSREPQVGAEAARQAIAMGRRAGDAAALLAAVLEPITPPAARLGILDPQDRPLITDDSLHALAPLLHPAIDAALDQGTYVSEWVLTGLEAFRWLGEKTRAGGQVGRMHERLLKAPSLFSLLPLREVLDRLDVAPAKELFEPSITRRFLEEFRERPRVCGVYLLSEAEIRFRRDGTRPPKDTLAAIEKYLGEPAKPPSSLQRRLTRLKETVEDRAELPLSASPVAHQQSERQASTITIGFGRRDDHSLIADRGEAGVERPIASWFKALTGGGVEEFTQMGMVAPLPLAGRLAHDSLVGFDITQLLCDDEAISQLSAPTDLRVQTSHSMFGAIPWELAQVRDGRGDFVAALPNVRCLYRSAPAGVSFRPGVLTGVKRLEQTPQPRSVLILRRSFRAQVSEVRGSAVASFDIEQVYRKTGWLVTVLEDPTPPMVKEALVTTHAQVLHINVHVAEAPRTGGLYLEIGRDIGESVKAAPRFEGSVRRSQGLPVADLVGTLHPRTQDPAPVLVLDPPGVPSKTEAARQLLLRNAFASDAFQLGVVPAIIATGLLGGQEAMRVGSVLVFELDAGHSLGVVCAAMRRQVERHDAGDIHYPIATALFAQDPDYAPLTARAATAAR